MKKQRSLIIILLSFCTLTLFSCDKSGNGISGYRSYMPQFCEYMTTIPAKQMQIDESNLKESVEIVENEVIKTKDLYLIVITSQFNIDSLYKSSSKPDQTIRSKMYIANYSGGGYELPYDLTIEKELRAKNPKTYSFPYRLTGVSELRIRTVDTPLFGLPAGSDLKDYFQIVSFGDDPYIISHYNKTVIQGKTPADISDWLGVVPNAQPNMSLRMRSTPAELPVKVQFVIEMVTVDGKIISDTTKTINLIR